MSFSPKHSNTAEHGTCKLRCWIQLKCQLQTAASDELLTVIILLVDYVYAVFMMVFACIRMNQVSET